MTCRESPATIPDCRSQPAITPVLLNMPLFQAALTHAADGFTVSWIQDGASEVYQTADLMSALEILRTKLWPTAS